MTPKQEKFAQCVADGMSQADAYRTAFDVKPTTKPETIQDSASKLMTHPEVSHRVRELKEQLSSKALWTRADSVRALETAMRIAQDKENAAGLVAAIKELNAMHGFNEPSKLELTGGTNNVNRVEFLLVNT
jgi:hypothetical protein